MCSGRSSFAKAWNILQVFLGRACQLIVRPRHSNSGHWTGTLFTDVRVRVRLRVRDRVRVRVRARYSNSGHWADTPSTACTLFYATIGFLVIILLLQGSE